MAQKENPTKHLFLLAANIKLVLQKNLITTTIKFLKHKKHDYNYRVSSKERPGRSFESPPLKGGALSRGAFFRGRALIYKSAFFGGLISFRRHTDPIFPYSCE